MNTSLLLNWFTNLGRSIKNGLGETGVIICIVVFFAVAACCLYSVIRNALITVKLRVAWPSLIFCIIFILLAVWFIFIM